MKEYKRKVRTPGTFKGVAFDKKRKKWYARIAFSGVRYALGRYDTQEEAIAAYQEALNMGGIRMKAWYNKAPEYRGKLGVDVSGVSDLQNEEDKLRSFSSLIDGIEEENKQFIW